jgi:hypothetical protein
MAGVSLVLLPVQSRQFFFPRFYADLQRPGVAFTHGRHFLHDVKRIYYPLHAIPLRSKSRVNSWF